MVAVLKAGSCIRNTLHYNENKVEKGQAILIHAEGFAKDKEHLRFTDKLQRFQKLLSLNEKTKLNSIHISLNFDSCEHLPEEKLVSIAGDYMGKIGFANQPYLVYQHHDAAHPHIHIVTTNIQRNGSRISLHNIGRDQSESARKEIEIKYGLIQASGRHQDNSKLKPVNSGKAQYGKSETKRAITNVLDAVLPNYKYTSLAELNAVLQLYNVVADTGTENSRIRRRKGLVYRILNERGEKLGVPIKASLIYNKPTLKNIEARFPQNQSARTLHKPRIKNAVDSSLHNKQTSLQALQQTLNKQQISTILRQNENGIIYGITYVDHQTKCVFNGSDLGKQYSANAIQQRCQKPAASLKNPTTQYQPANENMKPKMNGENNSLAAILHHLTESTGQSIASELLEDNKRKRKKQKRQQ